MSVVVSKQVYSLVELLSNASLRFGVETKVLINIYQIYGTISTKTGAKKASV